MIFSQRTVYAFENKRRNQSINQFLFIILNSKKKQIKPNLLKTTQKSPWQNNQHLASCENNTLNTCGRGQGVKKDFSP